ncbi:hypothetical protein [Pelomonas sp. KK5]|uniref:DUF7689 domain-containing protein n=1 Tax=Pelomonas sp. KK5 TaxID=1855730 RepID=UPI001301FE69|nr:hypothetical protein [Pelomonas sp. KK5]
MKESFTLRKKINEWFPDGTKNLASLSITSPIDWKYNCVAWAVGLNNTWLEPSPAGSWPVAHAGSSIDAYAVMFNHYGFVDAADGKKEKGLEKIVIYGDSAGNFLHVARQLENGKWTSKLGGESDITHATPQTLAGKIYGTPLKYMARPKQKAS